MFSLHLIDTEHIIDKYLYSYIFCVLMFFPLKSHIIDLLKNWMSKLD